MKNEIINLCKEIKKNNKCDGCGGRHNNYTCFYCGNENSKLKELEIKLINILNMNINLDEDIFMALFSIKSLNISVVDNILKENSYYEILNNKYLEICNKIDNNLLSEDEHKYMLYFVENNLLMSDRYNQFVNLLMKEMLLGKFNGSNEMKIILIKKFTEMFMAVKVRNPECKFEGLEDDTIGNSFYNRIFLDINAVNGLLEKNNYEKLLDLIFHECTHTYQFYLMEVDKNIGYNNLLKTKEQIIRNNIPGYYDENYVSYFSEVEARYMGAYLSLQYINFLNLRVNNHDYFQNICNRELGLMMNQNRVLNGNDTTVDELFLVLNKVELLNRYPVLNVEFKVVDGKIIKKSVDELLNDYTNYKNGNLMLNGSNSDIEFMYNYLINGEEKRKERS